MTVAQRKTLDNPLGLEPVDGEPVTELGIEIPGAAGGFREPLAVDTTLLDMLRLVQIGDTVYAVLELSKIKVRYQPAKDHDGLKRVDIFGVTGTAIIDGDQALAAINEQRGRVTEALEKLEGIQHLFDADGNPIDPNDGDQSMTGISPDEV